MTCATTPSRRTHRLLLVAALAAGLLTATPGSASAETIAAPASGISQITGHGYGHGHGMSQDGAIARAQAGQTAQQILAFYYPSITTADLANSPIRVALTQNDDKSVTVAADPALTYTDAATATSWQADGGGCAGATAWRVAVQPAGGLMVQCEQASTWVTARQDLTGPVDFAGPATLTVYFPAGAAYPTRSYRGSIRAVQTSAGHLKAVNLVGLEAYVAGVVAPEIGPDAPAEAMKAQAIAARSYGAAVRAGTATSAWDLDDSAHYQYYGAVSRETAASNAAVSATENPPGCWQQADPSAACAGTTLLQNGAPFAAEYSSCNGGYEAADSYIPAGAKDDYDPLGCPAAQENWSATLNWASLAAAEGFGSLANLSLTRDGAGQWGGWIVSATLSGIDSNGTGQTRRITGGRLRGDLGLMSAYFGIDGAPAATGAGTPGAFFPIAPYRVYDSRDTGLPVGPGQTVAIRLTGRSDVTVPATATAVQLNVTAGWATAASHFTVWPAGQPRPEASSLNFAQGQVVAATTTVKLGTDGAVDVYNNSGSTVLVVDLQGYYADPNAAGAAPGGSYLHVITPARLLDTRTDTGGHHARLGPGSVTTVKLAGAADSPVPDGATAVVVNLTATGATDGTYLTAWPSGLAKPHVSNINVAAGETRSNLAVVPLGADGALQLFNPAGSIDVVLDVQGWFGTAVAGEVAGVTPYRVLDTRTAAGGAAPLAEQQLRSVAVLGAGGVPADASAVLVTLTAVAPSKDTWLRAWADGTAAPYVSNVNLSAGDTVPNLAVVPVGADGKICVFNSSGTVHLVIDIVGYVAAVPAG